MSSIGATSLPTNRPVQLPLPSNAVGSPDGATPAGAGALLEGLQDPVEARAAAEHGLAEMAHAHDLAPCERQALVELLAWREMARKLYPSVEGPDAMLRPPTGPDAAEHLARSVRLALEPARQVAVGAQAVALASAATPRDLAIASGCAKLLSEQLGPEAYDASMVSDWDHAPRSKSFPAVPARFLAMALCNADLRQADLRRRDLRGLDLSSLCLAGADLRDCDIGGGSFKNADLSGAKLQGVQTHLDINVDFSGANLRGANLAYSRCEADYRNTDLRHTNLQEVKGFVQLDGAELTGVDLSTCNWHLQSAQGAVLRGATLSLLSSACVTGHGAIWI
ncbi:pentapeptide repeat-containing protein [Pseudoxanthomonas sp. UTMC 1351]|uniref:pentapeptide repeat-containing protein n=1 Tax=Pseudoxanthomonas sp. UTMC 1351 TaxID=2695853 RepID=UPI0034CF56A5